MAMRRGLVGLAGVLATVGVSTAKPPDLPAEPLVEGRELSPVVREFYESDVPRPPAGFVPTRPLRTSPTRPVADFFTDVRDAVLNRFTIPLGTVPVSE